MFTFAISLWHQKFVTADVTAVFVINMASSDEDKILIKAHNTLSIHSYSCKGIKVGALKMPFVCIFSISGEYLQKIVIFDIPR